MRHNDPVTTPNFGQANRVVIIGGGPGGYEAALVAAQLGGEVTVVDSDGLGGSAVVTDCVPSKTLIATAELMTELAGAPELGVSFEDHEGDQAHHVAVDLGRGQRARAQPRRRPVRRHRPPPRARGRAGGARTRATGRVRPGGGRASPTVAPRPSRPTPCCSRPGAAPRTLPTARAGRRADPHVGAGLRPHRGPDQARRGRFRRHGCGVRQRLHGAGHRGRAGVLARPGAPRRGRRRRDRARGRAHPSRHGGALQVEDGVGPARRRRGDRHPHRRPHGRRLALPARARVRPQDAGPRSRGGRRRRWTRAASCEVDRVSRTTARGVYAAGDCTGVLMLASVAAMQGRIAMRHFLGDAVTPIDLKQVVLQRVHRPRDRHRRLVAEGRRRGRDRRRGRAAGPGRQPPRQDAGRA